MSRSQAICYFILALIVVLALLVLLGIFNIGLMLVVLFALVMVLGLVKSTWPGLFGFLKKPAQEPAYQLSHRGSALSPPSHYSPNLILVADNLPSVEQVTVDRPVFTLGRDAGCNFCISNMSDISRVHATIRYDAKSSTSYIVDNNSHNGTFVNGTRLVPDKPKRLGNGDYIQIGTIRFTAQIAHY